MAIVWLRVPAEDTARVGRVVSQRPLRHLDAVHPYRHGAREGMLTGHRVAVGIAAGIVKATASHVVAVVSDCGIAILAVEALCRSLDDEGGALHSLEREPRRPRN